MVSLKLIHFTLLLVTINCTAGMPAAPTNLRISAITCTSATLSWDGAGDATQYQVQWMLINAGPGRTASGSRTASAALTSYTLMRLTESSEYFVQVTSLRNGIRGDSSSVTFTANCPAGDDGNSINGNSIPAPSNVMVSEVTSSSALVTWDIVDNVNEYQVQWRMLDGGVTMTTDVIGGINNATLRDLEPNRQYVVGVSSLSSGVVVNVSSEVLFVTDSTSSTESTELVNQMNSTDPIDIINSMDPTNRLNSTDPTDLTNSMEPMNSIDPTNFTNSTDPMIHTITSNGIVLVAPMDLTAQIVSYQMLMISWNYPPSLLAQTIFKVTYNLVSAYNTSAGMKSFAEYDVFNTTETSFPFALVSSVTSYIFTVTPYSATCVGDSARVLVDDFSGVDLAEDPVIFFNLRLRDTTNSFSLLSDHINNINSNLTRHIQSSINDICECTLPSYTLRGSMDSCDGLQSNCAIYTGRLLGSDTASATEVFEMVEDWLATQNGSLLDGTLSVDPDCPLQRLSPSDTACSAYNIISPPDDNKDDITLAQLLIISVASVLVTVVICSIITISALCVCRSRGAKKDESLVSSTYAQPVIEDNQRHYSVIVQGNPSYGRSHSKYVRAQHNPSQNGELNNTITSRNSNGSSHTHQLSEVEQHQMMQSTYTMTQPRRNASETTSTGYVDIYSSSEYSNDNIFADTSVSYLSITHT